MCPETYSKVKKSIKDQRQVQAKSKPLTTGKASSAVLPFG
jgi:hypothetical protein